MNIHNHSLWPPPARSPLIVPVMRSPHDGPFPVIQPLDKG